LAISDQTFDVLTALQSKLEAVAVYETYIEDFEEAGDDRCRQLFEDIRRDDEGHAERLRGELQRLLQER
jgi:bacterioferritin (cytochrome b1)